MTQEQPSAIVTSAQSKLDDLRGLFERNKRRIAEVIPKHVTPERLLKITLSSLSRSPEILECTRESIVRSVIQAAELGLEFGGTLGHAYLVPHKNTRTGVVEATFIPGYRGLIHLARQSAWGPGGHRGGAVLDVRAELVHEGDVFEVSKGSTPSIIHRPNLDSDEGDALITHAYCISKLANGEQPFDVMTRAAIGKIRDRARAKAGTWATDFGEMARKTVVKRRMKYVPLSVQLQAALAADQAYEDGEPEALRPSLEGDAPALPAKSKSESLKERLAEQAAGVEAPLRTGARGGTVDGAEEERPEGYP